MKCAEFRLAAEDRPAGAVSLSPSLGEHLDGCPACRHWEDERIRWGDLGELFREEAPGIDGVALRARVRAAISTQPRPKAWLRPAWGGLAAGLLLLVLSFGLLAERDTLLRSGDGNGGEGADIREQTLPPEQDPSSTRDGPTERARGRESGPAPGQTEADGLQEAVEPLESSDLSPADASDRAEFRVVRVGDSFGVEWPGNGDTVHRVVRSNSPKDFSGGQELLVRGSRWQDPSQGGAAGEVLYYLID